MSERLEATEEPLSLDDSNPAFGSDELNLAEFPLSTFGARTCPEQRTLTFEDEIFDEGNQQRVQRKLVVSASDAFGMPTPVDSDVLLVLMHLTNYRNRFQSPTVHFSRYELAKFLGWDNSGKSHKRLEESLQRWASVTLYYNRAWWDRDRRRWRSQTFHVLESLDLRGRDGPTGSFDDGQSSFTWNQVLFSSFQSNHLKRLDLGTYFRLEVPAARQAYRFLDKRFYRSQRFEMSLRTFACEHVGFARNYDNAQLKRKLQPALQELESIGFLAPASPNERFVRLRHGEWQIVLVRQNGRHAVPAIAEADEPLLIALTDRGVRAATAAVLLKEFSAARVTEKIEIHDWLLARKDVRIAKNPAGFLATAIRDDFKPPRGFLSKEALDANGRRDAKRREAAAKADQESAERTATRQDLLAAWEALPESERSALEAAAIASGPADLVAKYRRIKNPQLATMLLKEIVLAHLRDNGSPKVRAASAV